MNRLLVTGALFLAAIVSAEPAAAAAGPARPVAWAEPVAGTTLGNCFRVGADLYRSHQPQGDDLPALQALGIRSLLDLRRHHADDPRFARAGLVLLREGMRAGDVSVAELIRALRQFRAAPKPVLVHCRHGSDRTGFFIAGYRIVCEGWSADAAIDELRRGGYGYHAVWYPNIVRVLRSLDVAAVRRRVFAPDDPVRPGPRVLAVSAPAAAAAAPAYSAPSR